MPSPTTPPPIRAILEIRIIPTSSDHSDYATLVSRVKQHASLYIRAQPLLQPADLTSAFRAAIPEVAAAALSLSDDADTPPATAVPFWHVRLSTHVFTCADDFPARDAPPSRSSADDARTPESDASAAADALADVATLTALPSVTLLPAWDRLHLLPGVKPALLGYVRAGWMLAARGVDARIVAWNGLVLLHGPPGTGKTSLCRALAHKLAVTIEARDAVLVEVRLERLMSKWFSESSVRVRALFDRVRELAHVRSFVVVLLDEVESVGLSRKGRVGGGEPGDAIRVVNALLGGVDALCGVRNCVVVCTSNLPEGIDEALVDRADVRLHLGAPCAKGRRRILQDVVEELKSKGIVEEGETDGAWSLQRVCDVCEGLSGRALRKLAVVALGGVHGGLTAELPVVEQSFLEALAKAAQGMLEKAGGEAGEGNSLVAV